MSMFEDGRYRWRETYFVLFDAQQRPALKNIAEKLSALNDRFELTNLNADEDEKIDSLTLISPDDYSALDICYTEGVEATEQAASLVEDMKKIGADAPPIPWEKIKRFDGRFDVLHFEQVPEGADEDEDDGMFDPSTLLLVLGALAELTGGAAIDPQAGIFLGCEEEE